MNSSVSNFSFFKSCKPYIITADSEPDYDEWGPDCFWGCSEWIQWHKAQKAKYGKAAADANFSAAWSKNGWGSAPLDCRTFNSEFRNYMRTEKLLDAAIGNAAIVRPIGAASDVLKDASEVITTVSSQTKNAAENAGNLVNNVLKWLPWVGLFVVGVVIYIAVSERKSIIAKV